MYIFYSMFGFQRTGDNFWAAGDQMGRGFIIGATAGRTTLFGEGLQHMDGHSPILASTNPAVIPYDPAFAYEMPYIISKGIERMYGQGAGKDENVMYYITVYNQPHHQPARPENLDVEGLHKGIYLYDEGKDLDNKVSLLASGVGMQQALRAQEILQEKYNVGAAIYSVTSWTELAREGQRKATEQLRNPEAEVEEAFATKQLKQTSGPYIATSDFASDLQEQIRAYVPGQYIVLGADGFGFADTREAARRYFNIDAESMVVAALMGLANEDKIDRSVAAEAAKELKIDDPTAATQDDSAEDVGPENAAE